MLIHMVLSISHYIEPFGKKSRAHLVDYAIQALERQIFLPTIAIACQPEVRYGNIKQLL